MRDGLRGDPRSLSAPTQPARGAHQTGSLLLKYETELLRLEERKTLPPADVNVGTFRV